MTLKVGDIITFERAFTPEDVALFTNISGDEGSHHVTLDEQGIRFLGSLNPTPKAL
jgi:3-hydroxybutyryl-CoA dehydratase